MKKITLFIIILCNYSFSQTFGSGIITIKTDDGEKHPITIRASHLTVNPEAFRSLFGFTNEPIFFNSWFVDNSLGINNSKANLVRLIKNPSNKIYIEIEKPLLKAIDVKIYDIHGRFVSNPVISYTNKKTIINDELNRISNGVYFVKISGEVNQTIKFVKNSELVYSNAKITRQNGYANKQSSHKKNNMVNENYNISWYGNNVDDSDSNVQIQEGSNNAIIINSSTNWGGNQETGDVNIITYLDGFRNRNVNIRLTNTLEQDSTYVIEKTKKLAIFWNIYVSFSKVVCKLK